VAWKFNVKSLRQNIVYRSLATLTIVDRRKVVLVIIIQIAFSLMDLIGVGLVGVLGALAVNGVQSKAPGDRVGSLLQLVNLENSSLKVQAITIGVLAATFLISKTVFSVIFVRKTVFFLSRRSAELSSQLVSKVLAQPLVGLQSRSMQETLYSVTSGVEAIGLGILNTTVLLVSDISLLLILGSGLIFVDAPLAISTFIIFSLIGVLLYRLLQVRATKLGALQRQLSIQSYERIFEVLNSYREITVRNRRSFYVGELSRLRFQLANVNAERMFMPNISKYVIELTVVIGFVFIAAIQFSLHDAAHAISVLSLFLAASTRISPAILRMQQGAISIKSNVGTAGPTLDLIDQLSETRPLKPVSDTLNMDYPDFHGGIQVKNISYRYPGNSSNAISALSISVIPGSIISFVGPSGAGKTTLVDILLGITEPDSGQVLIQDLHPIKAIEKWPGAIGYVPQDVMISNGTIAENVALGFPNPDEEKIWEALRIARLDDFVRELPEGIATHVGDRGAKLSGGQRQRLGIARAMYTSPRLLVLDEATSSLDGNTEAEISEAVHNLRGEVTVIMIAHRLSTVKQSDVVHYISDGSLVASGTFAEVRAQIPEFERQAQLMAL
jgi:ABC-type multidrug transport system fused ATPase/permease subunit